MVLRCKRLVVKLGGSVITEKDKPYTLAAPRLSRIARILGKYYQSASRAGTDIVIIHGGGSYGHYAVHEAMATKPVLEAIDAARIQEVMLRLALEVSSRLIEEGIPVTVIPGHVLCRSRSKMCDMTPIIDETGKGLVPLTYGDGVYDDGVMIISGDDLAIMAASALHADCLVYVSDSPGVLDKDGRTIPRLSSPEMAPNLGRHEYDVTGGMVRKLQKTFEFLRNHEEAKAWVVDIDGFESLLLEGNTRVGTLLAPE